MRSQRRPQPKLDLGMASAQFVARRGQVAQQVNSGGEEVRNHEHAIGAPGHAPAAPRRDTGLGQLQEARLDDRIGAGRGQPLGQLSQVVIGRVMPAAVGNQENGGLINGRLSNEFSIQETMSRSVGMSPRRAASSISLSSFVRPS